MFIVPAPKRSSAKKAASGVPGAAKTPTTTSGASKKELEEMATRHGWQIRPISYEEILKMSSAELRFHEQFNAINLENALALPGIAKERKDINAQWAAKKLWDDTTKPTPEQADAILAALERFKQTYPQFIASRTENGTILLWLKDRNMPVTFENLVESFEANALEGKLWLNPNAISAGSETEVSGTQLTSHHNFHKLILPQKRISETDRLSADEFYEQNKEILADRRTPPIIQARNAKAASTAAHFQQADRGAAKSGSTSVTDYERKPRGGSGASSVSEIEKASFRNLLRNLSADEYQQKMLDPQFKAACDRLGEK